MKNRLHTLNSNLSIKKKWDINNYSLGAGQYFDINSYTGNFLHAVFGFLGVFFGMHGDAIFYHLNLVFGFGYSTPTPGLIQWHSRIGAVIGGWAVLIGLINFYMVYRRRAMLSRSNLYGAKDRSETLVQGFPLLHDLIWGWPFLLGLSLILYTHPVDAMYGVFLGGFAYAFSYAVSKIKLIGMSVKMILNIAVGGLAIWLWTLVSITFNGFPPGWHDIAILPIF